MNPLKTLHFQEFTPLQFNNAEGGIRTHAPSRTNGFQDRLVMTTSIPLHTILLLPLRQRQIE